MQRFKIEMDIPNDVDPSSLLEQLQEFAVSLATDAADDEDSNNVMLDGELLDTLAISDGVSIEPISSSCQTCGAEGIVTKHFSTCPKFKSPGLTPYQRSFNGRDAY